MRVTVIGGGPGGLYCALLTKKRRPGWQVEVYEQNRADDTFGFGVVFSDETLHEFLSRDPRSFARIRDAFSYWDDVAIHKEGRVMRCGGNGFAGVSRMRLLQILQERCREEGVELHFGESVPPDRLKERFPDSDVIVACDGINSRIREHFRDAFLPEVEIKSNRFCWMGSTRPMDEFNYFFRETPHGIVCAHTYQYEPGRSTGCSRWDEACWQGHGFTEADEEGSPGSRTDVRRGIAGPRPAPQPLDLAPLPADLLPQLVARQHRAARRRQGLGAFLDRLGHQARHGMRHRALGRPRGQGRGGRPGGVCGL